MYCLSDRYPLLQYFKECFSCWRLGGPGLLINILLTWPFILYWRLCGPGLLIIFLYCWAGQNWESCCTTSQCLIRRPKIFQAVLVSGVEEGCPCADSYLYTGGGFLSGCSLGYGSIPSHHQMGAPKRAPSTTSIFTSLLIMSFRILDIHYHHSLKQL